MGCTHLRTALRFFTSDRPPVGVLQNREVPPLKYEFVYQLKRDFPSLTIILNGGVTSAAQIHQHLAQVGGVMLGREAYHHPYLLSSWDHEFFGEPRQIVDRQQIEERMSVYAAKQVAHDAGYGRGTLHQHAIFRHMVGLYKGLSGARAWRRRITGNGIERVAQTLALTEG